MENISYGTDGSKILELHKPGRTDLLNLLSICISLFYEEPRHSYSSPHTLLSVRLLLFSLLQCYTKYMLEAKDSQD